MGKLDEFGGMSEFGGLRNAQGVGQCRWGESGLRRDQ